MAEYLIIDNTDAEIAGVVDIESYTTLPLVAVGVNRGDMLKAFIDRYGDVLEYVEHGDMQTAFVAFLQSEGILPPEVQAEDDTRPVESPGGYPDDDGRALAEHEATGAADVPAEQPSDTDMEADAGAQTVKVRCFNCEGKGTIEFGDGSPAQQCNTCNGTGKLTMSAA